ncbi:hypothetical protein PDESU_06184 [Pontiella desulfatans]|uniref:Uncharacterized protein n=1 Tax=Pontiella desulfatans TaxID=2750659 RepID=A0A6C2UEE3_PONDE|nr:hypothetical protein PDESU_06184 [Pontiella desulfatans]
MPVKTKRAAPSLRRQAARIVSSSGQYLYDKVAVLDCILNKLFCECLYAHSFRAYFLKLLCQFTPDNDFVFLCRYYCFHCLFPNKRAAQPHALERAQQKRAPHKVGRQKFIGFLFIVLNGALIPRQPPGQLIQKRCNPPATPIQAQSGGRLICVLQNLISAFRWHSDQILSQLSQPREAQT